LYIKFTENVNYVDNKRKLIHQSGALAPN